MDKNNKLLEMLTGYAAAHQNPFNVFVHMIGIPTIMLGVMIPLTWGSVEIGGVTITLNHLLLTGFFLFYLTLDAIFAVTFLVGAFLVMMLAERIGALPLATSGVIAAACFFGGYAAQFIGHAVEKSMPVLVRHPIQANLAAPFFTVVELFKLAGLREALFDEVQREIAARRERESMPDSQPAG
jgi:uncharacterized membrane protein YGL010W